MAAPKLERLINKEEKRMSNEIYKVFIDNDEDIRNQIVRELKKELGIELKESRKIIPFREATVHDLASQQNARMIIDRVNWSDFENNLTSSFDKHFSNIYGEAGLSQAGALGSSFSLLNPRAVEYLREHSAEQIVEITQNTKEGLKDIMADFYQAEKTPAQLGREIRKHVGLHSNWAKAVENRKADLIGAGIRPSIAENRASRYAEKLKRKRADMIARTETIAASNQGRQEAWLQAGYEKQHKVWITTPDDRMCEECLAMDGQSVLITKNFVSPDYGEIENPPLHPHCRCATRLELAEPEDVGVKEPGEFETAEDAEIWLKQKYDIDGEFTYDMEQQDYPKIMDNLGYSYEEIVAAENNNFANFKDVNLDMRLLNESMVEFDRLAQKYPEVAERLNYIGTHSKHDMAGRPDWRWSNKTYAHASHDGRFLGLNPDFYHDYDTMAMSVENSVKVGWHPKGTENPISVLTHEFGHQVHNYHENNGWGKFYKMHVKGITADSYPTQIGRFTSRVTTQSFKNLSDKNLSGYAITSRRESFAEGFTVIELNPNFSHKYTDAQKEFLNFMKQENFYKYGDVIDIDSSDFFDKHGFGKQMKDTGKLEEWYIKFTGGARVYG